MQRLLNRPPDASMKTTAIRFEFEPGCDSKSGSICKLPDILQTQMHLLNGSLGDIHFISFLSMLVSKPLMIRSVSLR